MATTSEIQYGCLYSLPLLNKFEVFQTFWVFRGLECHPPPPPSCMLITVYRSCIWLTCMHTVPSTFQNKWPKSRPSTTQVALTNHQLTCAYYWQNSYGDSHLFSTKFSKIFCVWNKISNTIHRTKSRVFIFIPKFVSPVKAVLFIFYAQLHPINQGAKAAALWLCRVNIIQKIDWQNPLVKKDIFSI